MSASLSRGNTTKEKRRDLYLFILSLTATAVFIAECPAVSCANTASAIPRRRTAEQAREKAKDRIKDRVSAIINRYNSKKGIFLARYESVKRNL